MHVVFFDIDGTLVATGGAGQHAFQATLAEVFGIHTMSADVLFAGRSDRAIATDLFTAHGVEPSLANWERFRAGYVERLDQSLPMRDGEVLPGVRELIALLSSRSDVLLGLLTGNVREGARRKLGYFDLWHHFPFGGFGDEHLDRNDIAAEALTSARAHAQSPLLGNVVVIGDTLNDIRCGRSIGARCVGVPTGQTSADTLREGQPDVVVDTLEQAAAVLDLLDS